MRKGINWLAQRCEEIEELEARYDTICTNKSRQSVGILKLPAFIY